MGGSTSEIDVGAVGFDGPLLNRSMPCGASPARLKGSAVGAVYDDLEAASCTWRGRPGTT